MKPQVWVQYKRLFLWINCSFCGHVLHRIVNCSCQWYLLYCHSQKSFGYKGLSSKTNCSCQSLYSSFILGRCSFVLELFIWCACPRGTVPDSFTLDVIDSTVSCSIFSSWTSEQNRRAEEERQGNRKLAKLCLLQPPDALLSWVPLLRSDSPSHFVQFDLINSWLRRTF